MADANARLQNPTIAYEISRDDLLRWLEPHDGLEAPILIALEYRRQTSDGQYQLYSLPKLRKIYYVNNGFRKLDDDGAFREDFVKEIRPYASWQDQLYDADPLDGTTSLHAIRGLRYFPDHGGVDGSFFTDLDLRLLAAHFERIRFSGALLDFGAHFSDSDDRKDYHFKKFFALKAEGVGLLDRPRLSGNMEESSREASDDLPEDIDFPSLILGPSCPPTWYTSPGIITRLAAGKLPGLMYPLSRRSRLLASLQEVLSVGPKPRPGVKR